MLNDKFDNVKRRFDVTYFIYKNHKTEYGKWFVKRYIQTSMEMGVDIRMV
jgi:hypothetical protein